MNLIWLVAAVKCDECGVMIRRIKFTGGGRAGAETLSGRRRGGRLRGQRDCVLVVPRVGR